MGVGGRRGLIYHALPSLIDHVYGDAQTWGMFQLGGFIGARASENEARTLCLIAHKKGLLKAHS